MTQKATHPPQPTPSLKAVKHPRNSPHPCVRPNHQARPQPWQPPALPHPHPHQWTHLASTRNPQPARPSHSHKQHHSLLSLPRFPAPPPPPLAPSAPTSHPTSPAGLPPPARKHATIALSTATSKAMTTTQKPIASASASTPSNTAACRSRSALLSRSRAIRLRLRSRRHSRAPRQRIWKLVAIMLVPVLVLGRGGKALRRRRIGIRRD